MFGGNTYWWLGLIVFLFFVGLNVIVYLLRDKPELSYKIAYCIAVFFFVYKIGEYIYWQAIGEHLKIPVEFSAMSYFLFGITVTFRLKGADAFGVFCGFLAGLFYSIGFWISPDSFVKNGTTDSVFFFVMAILNHHFLYFGSLLMLANVRKFDRKKWFVLPIGTALLIAYSWIIHLFTPYTERYGKLIFVQICDGSIINFLFPSMELQTWMIVLYSIAAALLFAGVMIGFFALNRRLARKREKRTGYRLDFPQKVKFKR